MTLQQIQAFQRACGFSERELAQRADVSRTTLRSAIAGSGNPTFTTLSAIGAALGRRLLVRFPPQEDTDSSVSVPVVSSRVAEDGNWRIQFFNLVDAFRRTMDPMLIELPPVPELPRALVALLASTVSRMCQETGTPAPEWARRSYFLPDPWFVADVEALKATALVESPYCFRRNNIFVLANFLDRA